MNLKYNYKRLREKMIKIMQTLFVFRFFCGRDFIRYLANMMGKHDMLPHRSCELHQTISDCLMLPQLFLRPASNYHKPKRYLHKEEDICDLSF